MFVVNFMIGYGILPVEKPVFMYLLGHKLEACVSGEVGKQIVQLKDYKHDRMDWNKKNQGRIY